ncbi:MAG: outer membrane beta-barrel protein [Bryobacteraceae bacterium]
MTWLRTVWLIPLLALSSGVVSYAQSEHRKHNFTVGLGAAMPNIDLHPDSGLPFSDNGIGPVGSLFSNTVVLGVEYGYRFHRYFQADVGLDTAFGAADIRDYLSTQFGDLRIRDYQFMLPLGGRVVVPIADERVLFSAGGGGAYLRYSERIRQPFGNSGFRLDCPVCASRGGWGYYGLVGLNVALDRGRHFRLGATSRIYRADTDGDPFGPIPARRTRDEWINILGTFSFTF